MASNTEIMLQDLTNSPDFIQELLPAAERTALLYHLSYLCLANFSNLERIIRQRAVETQLLFGSSEALLLKCGTTSDDLVSSLLPVLKLAVENNEMILVVKSLEKASAWITEIVHGAKEIINGYEQHNRNVAACTSEVIEEKMGTKKSSEHQSKKIENLEKMASSYNEQLKKMSDKIEHIEEQIREKNAELHNYVNNELKDTGFLASLVPVGQYIINSFFGAKLGAMAKIKELTDDLKQLSHEKSDLSNRECNIQIKLTEVNFHLDSMKIEEGTVPDPVHLADVQKCLTRIQRILTKLKTFWESVRELLESLKKKTLIGEDIVMENMSENAKTFFLMSIDNAEKYWKSFGQSCLKAKSIFSLQTKDMYKFLESNPSPGSVEWKQEYESVMQKLNSINPDPTPVKTPAITE